MTELMNKTKHKNRMLCSSSKKKRVEVSFPAFEKFYLETQISYY